MLDATEAPDTDGWCGMTPTPDDYAAVDALFVLGCILTGYALITAARWAVEAHRAGMRRLALHRARSRCVHLDSWRQHVASVRGQR